ERAPWGPGYIQRKPAGPWVPSPGCGGWRKRLMGESIDREPPPGQSRLNAPTRHSLCVGEKEGTLDVTLYPAGLPSQLKRRILASSPGARHLASDTTMTAGGSAGGTIVLWREQSCLGKQQQMLMG